MMHKKLIAPSLLALVCALYTHSARAYDLWQAYTDAQSNDATYLAAVAKTESINAQKKQARAVISPTVLLTGSIARTNNTALSDIEQDKQKVPANVMFSLKQPLIAIDKITAYRQVDVAYEAGQLQLAQARQDLISRVVQTYFNAWLAERAASVAQAQVVSTEKQFKIAQKNFEVGNTTVIDQQEAEAAWQNAIATQITAQNNAQNAHAALEATVGHSITEPLAQLTHTTRLKTPNPNDMQQWITRATEKNHTIRIAQLNLRINELDVTRMQQQRLPTLSLTASHKWNSKNFRHDNDVHSKVSSIGLELSMPVFDGGLIGAQVEQARSAQTQAIQSLRGAKTMVEQTTRTAYNQAISGLASIAALEKASSNAQKAAQSNELGYKLGMRINVDVQNAQNIYAQTQNNLAMAQYNTIVGNVNLKAAVGELGDADVRYINDLLTSPQPTIDASYNRAPAKPLPKTTPKALPKKPRKGSTKG